MRALCKIAGILAICEFGRTPVGQTGHCPTCGGVELFEAPYGWLECRGCDFAILRSAYDRIMALPRLQEPFIGAGI